MRNQVARKELTATEARNLRTLLLLNLFAGEEIGARIAQARTQAGMTQPDLADVLGIGLRQVQNLEAGVSKPYKHLKEIAQATHRPFDWFLHGEVSEGEVSDQVLEELAEVRAAVDRMEELLQSLIAAQAQPRQAKA